MTSLFYQRLNSLWRVLATGSSFVVFGIGSSIISLFFLLLVAPLPVASFRKQRWIRCVIRKACLAYIHMMRALGLLTFSIKVDSTEMPKGNLIIANHPTLLDAVFLLSTLDNVCCIVKQSLWKNPFTCVVVKLAGYVSNNELTLIEQTVVKLESGENILIFPEGTRNTYDDQLAFKRGAANIAVIADCSILPVVIHCKPRTLQKEEQWYQIPDKPPHFSLHAHLPFNINDCIDTNKPRTVQYRHLTQFFCDFYRPHLSK